jgi:hypothetical protein
MKKVDSYETILEAHHSTESLVCMPFSFENRSILPAHNSLPVTFSIFELSRVLSPFKFSVLSHQAQIILQFAMFTWTPIIKVTLVLVIILKFDLSHIIQTSIPNGSGLSNTIFSDCRLKAVSMTVFKYSMTISLVIDELADEVTLVLKNHLTLADALVVHKLPLIIVAILEIVDSPPIPFITAIVTLVVLSIGILKI